MKWVVTLGLILISFPSFGKESSDNPLQAENKDCRDNLANKIRDCDPESNAISDPKNVLVFKTDSNSRESSDLIPTYSELLLKQKLSSIAEIDLPDDI
jgi:hypothetical protein